MKDTDENLRAEMSLNKSRERRCVRAVIFGLALEVVFAGWFDDPNTSVGHWGPVAADVIITLGVVGEFLFGRKAKTASEELSRRSEQKLAEAVREAGAARERTAALELELAKFRSPRFLTPAQFQGMADKLRPWIGTAYDMAVQANDGEMLNCLFCIHVVLQMAGWKPLPWQALGQVVRYLSMPPVGANISMQGPGVTIGMYREFIPKLEGAASALAKELTDAGFAAIAIPAADHTANPQLSANAGAIHIFVGPKR